jgi:DNA-binding NtrC family response regulator
VGKIMEQKQDITILIVDDEDFIRIVTQDILSSTGCEIILAEDGQEAVEIFKERHTEIDLVIMDMKMPKMNGCEAFYEMKKTDENCKVVIASGYGKNETIDECLAGGLLKFLKKPYKMSELNTIIVGLLK